MDGFYHHERSVISERGIQFDILIESRLVTLAELLRRRQLVERRAGFQILRAFAGRAGNLQERVALQRTRTKQLRLHAQRAHLLSQHRTLLSKTAKENYSYVLAL